jgi:hypothetical protein
VFQSVPVDGDEVVKRAPTATGSGEIWGSEIDSAEGA